MRNLKALGSWIKAHKLDTALISLLLVAGGIVSALNMPGYPQRFEDEGTYVSQAYAIKEYGQLTHYTYWYDHPPAGWIQIAGYLAISDVVDRYGSAISVGREFMLLLHLATIGLIYALARRLGIGSIAAAAGTALYAFSPLSVEFSRYVLLDNVALPWLLGAFLLALSPRRNLMTAIGAAICMAIAVLSKETFVLLLPVIIYSLLVSGDKRNRRYMLMAFGVVFTMLCASYVLYAALKGELFPGKDHVSLFGTVFWQLLGREGSGSIFDPSSGSRGLMEYWMQIDHFLLVAGAASMLVALAVRSLRPAGLALLIGLLLMLRTGYMPYPYIIVLLPFAALCVAGAFDKLIVGPLQRKRIMPRIAAGIGLLEVLIALIFIVVPAWQPKLARITSVDADASSRQTVQWAIDNIPRDNRMVVESALWTDLEAAGFKQPQPVWIYKTETDPAVARELGGWKGIDYVIINGPTLGGTKFEKSFPTISTAIENSRLAAEFGEDNQKILVYKVSNKE